MLLLKLLQQIVSTHSRLKAAGISAKQMMDAKRVSTHSRLKAAGDCQSKC